jgi:hypothetical protein
MGLSGLLNPTVSPVSQKGVQGSYIHYQWGPSVTVSCVCSKVWADHVFCIAFVTLICYLWLQMVAAPLGMERLPLGMEGAATLEARVRGIRTAGAKALSGRSLATCRCAVYAGVFRSAPRWKMPQMWYGILCIYIYICIHRVCCRVRRWCVWEGG